MRVFKTVEDLAAAVDERMGPTEWLTVDQDRVNLFAEATGDHQWIHVDVERAATGPFGRTVAHGYLTLALVPWFASQLFCLEIPGTRLNYGVNKVRFPNLVGVGARVRAVCAVAEVKRHQTTGHQLTMRYTIEIEGERKPACVAEAVVLVTT